MSKYKKSKRKLATFKTTTNQIVKFEAQPLSAEFTEDDGVVRTSGLIFVEGTHIDSKQRKHEFPAERVQRIVENTNELLQQGARLPLLTDHQKTQDTTIGDVEGHIEGRIITAADIKNPRHKHLIGRFGAFASQVCIKSANAINHYKEKLLSTVSPGIDIISDTIREISCTSTPAIIGPTLFGQYDNTVHFALSFDELEQSGDQIDELKTQFDAETEKLWIVITSILTASDEMLAGQDQSQLIEQSLDDFENRVLDVLGVEEDNGSDEPTSYQQEDQQAQQNSQGAMPRTISQRGNSSAQYQQPQVLAAFTLDEMEKLAQFGLGSTLGEIATTARTRLKGLAGAAKTGIKGAAETVGNEARATKSAATGGFLQAKSKAAIGGAGKLRSNLSGLAGAAKRGFGTTGGKVAAAGLGATAVGATAVGVNKLRQPRKPKFK